MGAPLGPKYLPYTYMDPLGNEPPSWDAAAMGRQHHEITRGFPKMQLPKQGCLTNDRGLGFRV